MSECKGCGGNGIDCCDECIKPAEKVPESSDEDSLAEERGIIATWSHREIGDIVNAAEHAIDAYDALRAQLAAEREQNERAHEALRVIGNRYREYKIIAEKAEREAKALREALQRIASDEVSPLSYVCPEDHDRLSNIARAALSRAELGIGNIANT